MRVVQGVRLSEVAVSVVHPGTGYLIELRSRKVIHVAVTRSPTDAWTAQQLREATPYGQTPKYLIRDNDSKFGPCFARIAVTSGIKVLKTPYSHATSQCDL
jgi:hypothetical protein